MSFSNRTRVSVVNLQQTSRSSFEIQALLGFILQDSQLTSELSFEVQH